MPASNARRARLNRKRRRRVAAADNDLTSLEWEQLRDAWGGCAYCGASGVPLQRDCVQPISRGGRYTIANVVPACASCNASKSNGEVTTWMRRKKLDERTFLLRMRAVHDELLAGATDRQKTDAASGTLASPEPSA